MEKRILKKGKLCVFDIPIHCVSHRQLIFNQDKLPYQLSTSILKPAFFLPLSFSLRRPFVVLCDTVDSEMFVERTSFTCKMGLCQYRYPTQFLLLSQLIILIKMKLSKALEFLQANSKNRKYKTLLNVSSDFFFGVLV